jgi:hypothetical protein
MWLDPGYSVPEADLKPCVGCSYSRGQWVRKTYPRFSIWDLSGEAGAISRHLHDGFSPDYPLTPMAIRI